MKCKEFEDYLKTADAPHLSLEGHRRQLRELLLEKHAQLAREPRRNPRRPAVFLRRKLCGTRRAMLTPIALWKPLLAVGLAAGLILGLEFGVLRFVPSTSIAVAAQIVQDSSAVRSAFRDETYRIVEATMEDGKCHVICVSDSGRELITEVSMNGNNVCTIRTLDGEVIFQGEVAPSSPDGRECPTWDNEEVVDEPTD